MMNYNATMSKTCTVFFATMLSCHTNDIGPTSAEAQQKSESMQKVDNATWIERFG